MVNYVLDSNFFIQAHRMHYPFDVFPSFWNTVLDLAQAGTIVSIDKVKSELIHNKDELTAWIENNIHPDFFKETDVVIGEYAQVVSWASSRASHYKPAALNEFLHVDEADAWLVAYSLANPTKRILITHETSQPEAKRQVKIPEACAAVGTKYLNTVDMFRRLGVRF